MQTKLRTIIKTRSHKNIKISAAAAKLFNWKLLWNKIPAGLQLNKIINLIGTEISNLFFSQLEKNREPLNRSFIESNRASCSFLSANLKTLNMNFFSNFFVNEERSDFVISSKKSFFVLVNNKNAENRMETFLVY